MKKLIVAIFAAAALAFVAAPVVTAAPDKVTVCHFNGGKHFLGPLVFGITMEVTEKALPAHLAHGDRTEFVSWDIPLGPKAPTHSCGFVW